MGNVELLIRLVVALAIGLLIGSERGWHEREAHHGLRVAGVRTFGLVALLGGLLGLLSIDDGLLILGLALIALSLILVIAHGLSTIEEPDYGITTCVAADGGLGRGVRAAPPFSDEQTEAMHLLESLAAGDELRLDMDFRPGDIQVLHNHPILHARTDYQDHPEPERRRHLLRLWLSARNGRVLPAVFAERYGEIGIGKRRGGIRVPGAALTAPLDAA